MKCKDRGFYKGGVGNARQPRVHNRNFLSHGPVSTQMAQNVPPKIGPRWVNIAPRWPNIGPRWPNIGPILAPEGTT